jgi:hypothetical protein
MDKNSVLIISNLIYTIKENNMTMNALYIKCTETKQNKTPGFT